jgi:hypothetical protein
VFAQEHAAALRVRHGARTAGLTVTLGTLGDYLPGAASRSLLVGGSARAVGRRSILPGRTLTAGLRVTR